MKYLRNSKPRTKNDSQTPPVQKKPRAHYPSQSMAHLVIPLGEDEASHSRHIKMLQLEERKVSPDKNVVADLMKRTFHFRRSEILEQPQLVQELIKTYPSLKRCDQVHIPSYTLM